MNEAETLKSLAFDWEWDADLMRCIHCQKALHIDHAGHGLNHSPSCRNGEQYPWERLHEAALSVVTHQRKGNLSDNIINEVRHEPLARQAQLWGAKEALEKAKFSDVISDGEEIFNAIADQAISQVETLIESTKND
jgi:hypothetical protein